MQEARMLIILRLERDKDIFLVIFVYLFVFLIWSVVVYTLTDVEWEALITLH